MTRYRITLTPTDDTGPGTADEADLREVACCFCADIGPVGVLACAIAAALPKPRIQVRPGMVLRRRSDGLRFMCIGDVVCGSDGTYAREGHPAKVVSVRDSLDPAEWTVLLDAEDGAS